ncbi:hypothetical protein DOT_3825 [Desulfosporosinus sp. OT]|nr:hypothetical protein DOT_3825 [Desulfosporosinus sp. OT]
MFFTVKADSARTDFICQHFLVVNHSANYYCNFKEFISHI